jgi:CRP-like cAMP-binding protein
MKILENFINNYKDFPKTSLKVLINLASEESYKKNDMLLETGEVAKYFYIIKSGITRAFYADEKGKQYIRTLFRVNETTSSLESLLSGKPSKLSYDCLTDCVVYKFDFKEIIKLTKTDLFISNLYSNILENIFIMVESRIYDLAVLNATERYLKLKKEIPEIENSIPQYHIASYLNISPVQLSRVRKELYSK